MSKLQKILIVVFCCGVLLCGLGTGIAFTEFAELSYGGMQYLGRTDIRTEDFDVEFEPGEEVKKIYGWHSWREDSLCIDDDIPENTVRFRVTYNAERIEPRAFIGDNQNEILFGYRIYDSDEIALMMEAKDVLLQNLKAGSIVSLDTLGIQEVTVMVNPENAEDVRLW